MLQHKEHSKNLGHTDYFMELVSSHYPQRLSELEGLQARVMLMDDTAHVSQLFIEKLIEEINMLWRAEKHYWELSTDMTVTKSFPKDYIVKKQRTISDLITHLHSLFFGIEKSNAAPFGKNENREVVLSVLSDYIDIEYKLCTLLIEKELRIYQFAQGEGNKI